MKKKNLNLMAVLLVVACGLLTACGGGSSKNETSMEYASGDSGNYDNYATDDMYAADTTTEEAETEMNSASGESAGETESVAANRKLIKNVNMTVETEEFDSLTQKIVDKVESLGGYIESAYVNGTSITSSYDSSRNASYTARIPADKLDGFVTEVSKISNVLNKSENVEDVTLSYVDLESKKETLEIEQERLTKLLEQADSIETIVALESRLTEIRYQLESMESQLRTYDNLVDYATVYLDIQEVERETPVAPQSALEKMSDGFVNSIYNIGKGFKNFVIGFVIVLPYLVVWALIILIIIAIVKAIINGSRKKAEKKQAALAASYDRTNNSRVQPKEYMDFGMQKNQENGQPEMKGQKDKEESKKADK